MSEQDKQDTDYLNMCISYKLPRSEEIARYEKMLANTYCHDLEDYLFISREELRKRWITGGLAEKLMTVLKLILPIIILPFTTISQLTDRRRRRMRLNTELQRLKGTIVL
ncbi:hypothetical protein AB4351_08280 [Vibrio sp. 10N.261.51.F11]|uniref:hypothetical protein n=1 Tax=Vibrio sp. 10N.261.51.F11 TaxID=3229678 RepID=UPI00354FD408